MTIQKPEAFDPAFTVAAPSDDAAPVPLTTLPPSMEPESPEVVEPDHVPEPQKPVPADANLKPTKETYDRLQQAFDHFNRVLFGGTLPNPLFTYQRRRNTVGYFSPAKFARADGTKADEIALNPTLCAAMPLPVLLSFMVHDMVHLWQHRNGAPGRGRYHNREWAEKMKAIGLHPTATGQEGGDETGEAVMHMIVPGGPVAQAADRLLGKGFAIEWREVLSPPDEAKGESGAAAPPVPKSGQRVRYCCPECDLKAWAKQEAQLICGTDQVPMVEKPTG